MKCRVLIADDSVVFRDLVGAFLQQHGFVVSTAADGLDAIEKFANDPDGYDVAILDIHMPFATGMEVWQAIDSLRPGFPVVFCGADVDNYAQFLPQEPHVRWTLKPPIFEHLLNELQAVRGCSNQVPGGAAANE